MTLTKTAMTVTSLALAAMFGGGLYFLMHMNSFAKTYAERSAERTLGVDVSIGFLEIALKERTAHVKNVKIGNPEGFKSAHAVIVPEINIVLDALSKGLVSLKDVDVNGTEVYLEVKQNTTNLAVIQNNARQSRETGPAAEAMRVIISKLAVSQAKLIPVSVLFSDADLPPILVPDIVMNGIGQKENGALTDDVIAQVWTHMAQKFNNAAAQAGFLEGMSPEALRELGVTQLQQFQENLKENVQGTVDNLNEGLKNLLGE